ncbi:outer membrane protein assembly factor BamE [bacterium]|nr:outer membrane protein assembly factor BamE [bacterium]
MTVSKKTLCMVSIMTAVLFVFAYGCATVGHDFSADAVSKIVIGKTTREDIGSLFGPPWRTGIEDGKKTWTYGYYKYRLFGTSTTRDLVVRFDSKGVVTSYTFNTTDMIE